MLPISMLLAFCYPPMCAMVKSRSIGDGHPTFNRNPYNGYINPYYWVDDHPLLYGSNGSLDPGTCVSLDVGCSTSRHVFPRHLCTLGVDRGGIDSMILGRFANGFLNVNQK